MHRIHRESSRDERPCYNQRSFIVTTIFLAVAALCGRYLMRKDSSNTQSASLNQTDSTRWNETGEITPVQDDLNKELNTQNVKIKELESKLSGIEAGHGISRPRSVEHDFLRYLNETAPALITSGWWKSHIPNDVLRRSRSRMGDRRRWTRLLDKLESGRCINVAILGASMSWGQGLRRTG